MFDFHAHIGSYTEDAIIATSRRDEWESAKAYPHRAYGILLPKEGDAEALDEALRADEGALLGEVGLDKRHGESMDEKFFLDCLKIAKELWRPFFLHIVGTYGRTLELVKSMIPLPPFFIHGFTGSYEVAKEFTKLGAYISLGRLSFRSGT